MRKLNIEIYRNYEWFIELKGFDKERSRKYFKFKNKGLVFPAQVADDDGKIAYMFDIVLDDETLKLLKDEPLTGEVCECDFIYDAQDGGKTINEWSKTCTIYEAFLEIKKNLKGF